jgi:ADP-ribose pyrophosphatase YjhB (NUDIX family)
MFYIVNVEGAIFHEGRYLLIVRGAEETHAAGDLALVGGKVEGTDALASPLEKTLRREILEETGVEVEEEMIYLNSSRFTTEESDVVIDIVFLCRYQSGTPTIFDPGEVAEIVWLTTDEVMQHPKAQPWTHDYIHKAERARTALGW